MNHGNKFTFDYIGISEIFKCEDDKRLNLPGYQNLITRTRPDSNRGGVGLFIKENINFKIRNDLSVFIPHVLESVFIEVISNSKACNNSIIGTIYRPNTQPKADLEIFTSTLYDLMDIINNEKKSCVIMGDFNIDLLKYSSHAKTNDYVDNIFTRGFVPLITKPTRIFRSSATLIDHIYSNNIPSDSQSGIIVTDVADHFGIFHTVRNKTKHLQNLQKKSRIFSDTNLALFKQYLDQSDFSSILTIDNPNNAYETFIDLYKQAYEKAFPLKIIKPNKKYIKKNLGSPLDF